MNGSSESGPTDNSPEISQKNVAEIIKVNNSNTTEIYSVEGKISKVKQPELSSKQDAAPTNEDFIKVSSAIDSEAESSKRVDSTLDSSDVSESATKSFENSVESLSKYVSEFQGISTNSDQVSKLRTSDIVDSDLNDKTTSTNLKSVDISAKIIGTTGSNSNKSLESKTSVAINSDTINNKTGLSETNANKNGGVDANKKGKIANKNGETSNGTNKKKPLSARDILKKSIEIRGRRLERIAINQHLEEVTSNINEIHGKVDSKRENTTENIGKETSTDEETSINNTSQTKNGGLEASQGIKDTDRNVLGVNLIVEKGEVNQYKDTPTNNEEVLDSSLVEKNGIINKPIVAQVNEDLNVVEQNFKNNSEEISGEEGLKTTLKVKNDDKIVKNDCEPVSLRRGRSRKSNVFQILDENVSFSSLDEVLGEIVNSREDDPTSLPGRKLRKRAAHCHDSKDLTNIDGLVEENGEKSGGKLLRKALKVARKTSRKISQGEQNFDTNVSQVCHQPSADFDFMESVHEIVEEKLSNSIETSGRKKLRNRNKVRQIIENVGEFEENVVMKEENFEDLAEKSGQNSEEVPGVSSKMKRKRGRPKNTAKDIRNVVKTSGKNSYDDNIEKVSNIDDLLREVLQNLSKSAAEMNESVKCCVENNRKVGVVKKKAGRPKTSGKNLEKLLENASSSTSNDAENCEKPNNCSGAAEENQLEPVRKLRKRTENSSKYVEYSGENFKTLESKIVLLADGPKMTIDPEVEVLKDLVSANKSNMAENSGGQQSTARYCTNNLTADGLRMVIKKETNNSLENKTSSPEIYEEDTFEYGNVSHRVRYIIRQEKIKQEVAKFQEDINTNNEEYSGDNVTDELIMNNNDLIQTIKEEPIDDNQDELLLENEDDQTREYTVNDTELKEKIEDKPFIIQQQNVQTIRFRNRSGRGRGRKPYLIAKTVNINSYVSRCKPTTLDNINNHGKYTMEIKSEVSENNSLVHSVTDSVGDAAVVNKVRGSKRVAKKCGRRSKVSDKVVDDSKYSKNLVNNSENCAGASDSSQNCEKSSSTLENDVRNSTSDAENVENSTNYVENVENSTDYDENVRNSTASSSAASNKILVKSLSSLVGKLGSNFSKNVLNSSSTSNMSSNRNLVKNLANLVSELDSIAKNNVQDNVSEVDFVDTNNSLAENRKGSSSSDVVLDSIEGNNKGIEQNSLDSIPNNCVPGTLYYSESDKNFAKTGSSTIPNEDVSNVSGTSNLVSNDNVSKYILSDNVSTSNDVKNYRKSLRKRKTIVNYDDDNFVKIVDNYDSTQDSVYCNENVEDFANLASSTSSSTVTNHVIAKSVTKIFPRNPKIVSKNKATINCKSRTTCEVDDKIVENYVDIDNHAKNSEDIDDEDVKNDSGIDSGIKTDLDIINNVKNNSNSPCKSQSNSNNVVENHTTKFSSTSERNCIDDIEVECSSPVKLEANTVPIDFDTVSNGGLLFDTVSKIEPDTVSSIEYEQKYSAVLEENCLKINDDNEFRKTIRSFLEEEEGNEENGKKERKRRRRPCEMPEIPKSMKCEICEKVLKTRQSYRHHMTTHNDPSKQWRKCSVCKKMLAGERRLKAHIYNFHTHIKIFNCDICKKIFNSRPNLYRHMVQVHLEPETYTCDICKKSFKKKSYLEQHINMHMGVRKYECNLCGKNFMIKTDLQNHLDAHVGFDRYVCGVCGQRMTSLGTMHIHMKRHTRENMFKCKRCGKEYTTKCNLEEHMHVHTGERYTCDICGAKFHYRNGYNRHMKIHDGKQQKCHICHKVFQRKCYLKKHMTIHMGTEQYMCVYCGKKFIEKSDYNIHVNRHTHAEKFPCEFCGKVFYTKQYLVNHRKLHTGDTQHVCKYCNKKFMKKTLLERHESIHEGTNFVSCDMCGAVLSSVNSCRRHVRTVHGVVV